MKTSFAPKFLQFILLHLFVFMLNVGWGQTTLLSANFGTTNLSLPTGWASSNTTNGWNGSTASPSSTYIGFSAGANVLFSANGTNGASHTLTYSNSLSTVGYSSITVLWGGRGTSTFNGTVIFQWSSDGTTWNNVSYTYSANGNAWALINSGTPISLPVGAAGQTNLRLRWSAAATNSGNYRIDDVAVKGTASTPTITSSGTLSATNTTYGSASATPTSFNVSGANMSEGILVTPPSGYEVSLTSGSGYASTVTVGAAGTIASTAVYVRLASATAVGSYSGNIVLSSTSATSVNVATVSSTVSAKALTISGLSAANKDYDGNTSVSVTGTSAYSGLVNGDAFTPTGSVTWAFPNANVGSNKVLTRTGDYSNASSNYSLAQPSLSASIFAIVPTAPAITVITAGDGQLSVAFNVPSSNGGANITNYEYSTNGGTNWTTPSSAVISSPLLITGLTNGTPYTIQIRAVNTAGSGAASSSLTGTPEAPASPLVTVAPSTFASAFSTTYGTASAVQSFTVSGATLSGDLSLTAPSGFEISLSNSIGFTSSLNFTSTSGSVSATTVYVRLTATAAAGSFNDVPLSVSGGGASAASIATTASSNAVAQKALTISGLSVANKSYDGNTSASVSGTAAYSGLANSETFAIVGSATATFASANVANGIAVTVTGFSEPSTNYSITQPSFTANISAVNLTISGISISNKTYNGSAAATITGTAAYQGLVNNESFAITGSPAAVFTSVNVGTSITVTVSGYTAPSANYTISQPTGLSADITQANQTITFNALANKTTSDVPFALTATASSALTVSYISSNTSVATISGSTVTIVGAGTTTITASQSGNENFNAAASVSQNLVVTIAPVVLGAWQFGNPAALGAETTSNSTTTAVNLNTITLTRGAGIAATGLGRAFASNGWDVNATKVNAISNNEYFQFVISSITAYNFSISTLNATLRRSASNAPNAYIWKYSLDGVNFSDIGADISFTSTADGAAQSQISLSGISALQNAKTVTFRLYAWGGTSATATFSIGRFATGVTSNSLAIGGNVFADILPPTLTANTTSNTVDNNIDITFTDDATWITAITAVKIGATTLTPATDYEISSGNIQLKPSGLNTLLTVAGTKAITVVATGYSNATVSQVINAGAPTSNSTATINSILASGATRTITCTAKDQYNNLVSGYTFKYDATIVANNANTVESYAIDDAASVASVNDVNLTTTTSASGEVTFTVIIPSVLDEADGISVQVQLANGSTNVGSAFAYHELPGQTITFNALNAVTYGDAAFTVSASGGASGNPVVFTSSNNAVATCTGTNGSTITIIGVGTASISANQAGNSGYNAAAAVSQTLTVNQKGLTISGVGAADKVYNGSSAAVITGTPAYVGLVNGETFSVTGTGVASFSDAEVGIGKTVNFSGYTAPSANYSITQPTATATISQATQTIVFASLPNRFVGGPTFTLGQNATSGLAITYTSSNTSVATIVGNTVTPVGAGTTTITASQVGNNNYTAAVSLTQNLTVIVTPVAGWDFFGQTSPATFAATTFNSNLDATSALSEITRGSGSSSNVVANAFSTTGFQNNGISTTNTDYFQVTLKANSGHTLSLSEINANFDGTSTFYATPGVTSQYAYSLNGTDFTLIGSPVTSTSLKPAAVDLTGVSALQSLPSTTTVTIRYYASGQTATGGWRFSSPAAGVPGLAIGGSLSCAIPSAPAAGNNARCGAGTVAISATPGTGETIDWYSESTGGTLLESGSTSYTTPSISSTTSYYAEARNNTTGCVSSTRTAVTATVNPLLNANVSITASATTICSGTSVTFTATPTNGGDSPSYVWKKNNSTIAGETTSTYSSTSLVNGDMITCEMTSNSTSCLVASSVNSNGVTMVVNALPTATISASGATTFCAGGNVTLTAGTSTSYLWSNNATAASINVSASGTYSVTVSNANGCSATASIIVTELTAPTASSTATSILCNGGTAIVTVTGTGGTGTYTGTGNFTVSAGTYSYTVTDANGCTSSTSITVTQPALVNAPTGTSSQTFCSTLNATLSSISVTGTAVQWYASNAGGSVLASTTPLVTGTTYYATQTIAGCQSSSYLSVAVTIPVASTYYQDADADGFGTADVSQLACTQPTGYVSSSNDCRDAVPTTYPGAPELCNGFDDNCSGVIDEGCAPSNPCPTDFNLDGITNVSDFLIFAPAFGNSCNACATDFNLDGITNVSDFLIFAPRFGIFCN